MNVFVLDEDPVRAAQAQCDRHVVKMVIETAQLLCGLYPPEKIAPPAYKRTHYNHPCSVWLRAGHANWEWLLAHGHALGAEYTFRYGKTHASMAAIEWCEKNPPRYEAFGCLDRTPFVLVMPEKYRTGDPVESYRQYYRGEKSRFAKWTRRPVPAWFSRVDADETP